MRREIMYSELWLIERDLERVKEENPGVAFLLAPKIDSFFQRNKGSLNILHKNMHEIQKKYIVHDEKNVPQRNQEAEGEQKPWLFLDSVIGANGELLTGEAIKKEYNEKVEQFLGRSVKVEL